MTVAYQLWCDDARKVERRLHQAFAGTRVLQGRGREFFAAPVEQIIAEIEGMAEQVSSHRSLERWMAAMAEFERVEGISAVRTALTFGASSATALFVVVAITLAVAAFRSSLPVIGAILISGATVGGMVVFVGAKTWLDHIFIKRRYGPRIAEERARLDRAFPKATRARANPMPEHPRLVSRR